MNLENFPKYFDFLSYQKDSVGTQKRVRIIHGIRAISDRVIEIRLYLSGMDAHTYGNPNIIVISPFKKCSVLKGVYPTLPFRAET